MIDACIFDLDGVIVDTARYHYMAWKRLADHLEIPFSEEDNEALKGISRMASLEHLISLGEKTYSDIDKQKFCLTKNTWYVESIEEMSSENILPGVTRFLNELRENNIKIALGSASKNARRVLELIDLTSVFEVIVDGNDVINSKPDPEVFLKGAQMLGCAPSRCVVFEDSAKGIDAAVSGGFMSVGIGPEQHLGHADMTLSSFEEVTVSDIRSRLQSVTQATSTVAS
ncbi:MAG: beta-phosphoglucomutase [Bacteroidota bacterium]